VYGIGCNAFNPVGIEKIYRLKGRNYTKPLPVLLSDASQLALVVEPLLVVGRKKLKMVLIWFLYKLER
jgi:tRNA A37 threonylcarbamoyladenosine synthetase subunit TsaC/SUA5/YrdC